MATPQAPVGSLWTKVLDGQKNPGRWPRGSADEAQLSPESDSCETVTENLNISKKKCK